MKNLKPVCLYLETCWLHFFVLNIIKIDVEPRVQTFSTSFSLICMDCNFEEVQDQMVGKFKQLLNRLQHTIVALLPRKTA